MREIKFRVWDAHTMSYMHKDNKTHYLPKVVVNEHTGNISLITHDELYDIQLSTGLKDKNGKEIYEGDIVKMFIYHTSPLPIQITTYICFDDGIFTVMKMNEEILPLRDAIIISNKTNQGIEVIGNVYENPELLNTPTESV